MSDVWQAAPMSVERWVSTRNPAVVWTVVVTDGAGVDIDPATTPVEDGVGLWCREIGEVPAGPVGDIDILWPESTFIPRVAAQVVAWS